MSIPLTGLIPASFTPMRDDGSVNLDAIAPLAQFYRDQGLTGVFVSGSSGECHALTLEERRAITAAWCDAAPKQLPVIVHVGSNSLPDAVELAGQAQDCGADGVSAMTPFYFKPKSVDDLIDFCEPIAAAAPDLPFYYYHIPVMTGVDLPVAEFLVCGAERIPTLAGVKFSNSNLMALQECLAADGGRFDVLFGHDEMLLAALALGVRGAIGSTYNFAAPLYHRVIEAFESGDLAAARREQQRSVEMINALLEIGILPACKAIMKLLGIDCGTVRMPLQNLNEQQMRKLSQMVAESDWGIPIALHTE